ncbi:MAG: beta-galactosidase [Victivallales bacterium]|nr:beta-galactosidase [Victivallales bacterium]
MKTLRIFSAFVLLTLVLAAADFARPQWIHYPEPDAEGVGKDRYFFKEFVVGEGLVSARVYFIIDDSGHGYLDGQRIPESQRLPKTETTIDTDYAVLLPRLVAGMLVHGFDVTEQLRNVGTHQVVLRGVNGGGPGGAICRLRLQYADGHEENIVTDLTWQATKNDPAELGDDHPVAVASHGDMTIEPWASRVDLTMFYPPAYAETVRELLHTGDTALFERIDAQLATETKPVVKVFYDQGKAMLDIDGVPYPPIIYSTHAHENFTNPDFVKNVGGFRDAGLHLYVMGVSMEQIWLGPGDLALERFDAMMRQLLATDSDTRVIVPICCSYVPKWWVNAHPEELAQYASTQDPPRDRAQDVQFSKYRVPSYASKLWQEEFNGFVRAVVEYIESTPYAKRVIGYRLDSGVYLEWHHYGFNGQMPDTSAPMTARFRDWLREHYASEADLQAAWNNPAVTFETAEVPGEAARLHQGAGALRDPVQDRYVVDYLKCLADTVADFLLAGDHTIKEASGRRALVGNFCGYFFEMVFQSEGWHQANDRILASPDVDFQCHPTAYGWPVRDFGEPQPARSLVSSYRLRGKLSITEADTRTHLCTNQPGHTFCKTPRDDVNALARDFCQSLCRGNAFWYFDFAFCWYLAPEVQEYFKKLIPIWNLPADNRTASEVLLIGDWDAPYYAGTEKIRPGLHHIYQQSRELPHAGAPFDAAATLDLQNPALPDYKVYVFLNMLQDKPEVVAFAEKLRQQGKTIVWLDHAGYLTENGADVAGTERLTTIKTEAVDELVNAELELVSDGSKNPSLYGAHNPNGPTLKIVDQNTEILGYQYGTPVYARKTAPNGATDYLVSVATLPRAEWRRIFQRAGVFCYNDDDDAVIYANRSFVMLHLATGGTRTVHFPREANVKLLLPEEQELGTLKDYTFEAEDRTTYLFYLQ